MKKGVLCKSNKFIKYEDYYEICLENKEDIEIARTKISKEDYQRVKRYRWCLIDNYCAGWIEGKQIYLHIFILGKKKGFISDHIDRDKLNNQRSNLRFCTYQQNNQNRKFLGICWDKQCNRWKASIMVNGKHIHLKNCIDRNEAIRIRKKAEKRYFREFAFQD